MIVFVSISQVSNLMVAHNYLTNLLNLLPYTQFEIVLFCKADANRKLKQLLENSPFSDCYEYSFIPSHESNKSKLIEYVNLKTIMNHDNLFYGVNDYGKVGKFCVDAKYDGIKFLTKLYDKCLYTNKGIMNGASVMKFENTIINVIYKRVIRKLSNLINYELKFLNPSTNDDNKYLDLCEKDRLMELSFKDYQNNLVQTLKERKYLTDDIVKYIEQRLDYLKRFDRLSKAYYSDEKSSEVFYHLSFYYYLVARNLFNSNKLAVCLAMCVRILEIYLTGYLMKHKKAKPDKKRVKIEIDKDKWRNVNGFGAIWSCFKDFYPDSICTKTQEEVDTIIQYRNISFYGHGYLSLTKERAEKAMLTVKSIIFQIEKNANTSFFSKCDNDWIFLHGGLQKGLIAKGFSLA